MHWFNRSLFVALLILTGCKDNTTPKKSPPNKHLKASSRPAASRPASIRIMPKKPRSVVPPKAWLEARVADAKKRLNKTEAGQLLWKSIQAHGGLNQWFSKGALDFRFTYKPLKKKRPYDTTQTIELWSAKARHTSVANKQNTFGWDGKRAWKHPKDAKLLVKPRFWALTPFYFVGVPFVFADPGIILKKEQPLRFEKNTYDQIRVTYKQDIGDAPDDFYVVLIHQKTKRVGGVRYIVSYPGFFPKGKHSPEKLMSYDGLQTIEGIHFPKTFRTFKWNGKKPTRLVTRTTLSQISFKPNLTQDFFKLPTNAQLLELIKK